ncbi:MAG: proton-conducting transporter membrane subunit [Propionibacteriaceae bacterium]|nr:proton-conducting transporter membrane subunit [Propionibacteriaceae bacterium]
MTVLISLCLLGAALLVTPSLTRVMNRHTGWFLAAVYIACATVLAPDAVRALTGEPTSWSHDWVPQLGIRLAFTYDATAAIFSMLALLIGAVVLIFATRYLPRGRHRSFYLVMVAFTIAMVGLVAADDLVVLFICWEITSLASFLLIARSGHGAEGSAMRTLLITFTGGVVLLVALCLIWARLGTTRLSAVLTSPVWAEEPGFAALVALLVAIAACTKAAQFPFHVWLPDAMAAVTPVSAYLHAAAVVKAGIFLMIRFSPAFHDVAAWNWFLTPVGLLTMLIGGWCALQQNDVKKLMACSTVSQLGLITAVIGVGTEKALAAALFHTIAHALFKSGLFMLVGVVDHATGTRDLRRFPPKLYRRMPVTFTFMLLGTASMAGLPPMLGFASKEAVLAALYEARFSSGLVLLVVATLGSVLTFLYCARTLLGIFVDGPDPDRAADSHDPVLVASAAAPIAVSVVAVFWPKVLTWHGISAEFIATVVVIALGLLAAWQRQPIAAWITAQRRLPDGPTVIRHLETAVHRLGTAVDRMVATDTVTRHVIPILGGLGVLGLVGSWVAHRQGLPPHLDDLTSPVDVVVFVLITVATLGVCISRVRVGAVVSLSAVGILATVQILALGAPDVAMTQLLVESLTIIVIMLVLQKLPARFPPRKVNRDLVALGAAVLVGAGVAALVWALVARRERSDLADYFLGNTEALSAGQNVVNVILVEFRGFDTLGELSVLGMAGVAMLAILSTVRDRYLDPPIDDRDALPVSRLWINQDPTSRANRAILDPRPNAIALKVMLKVIVPMLILISLALFWRGHNGPGGGFNAALVASSVLGLLYLSTTTDRQIGPPRLPLVLIGGGILVAVSTGLLGLGIAGSFLEPIHGTVLGVHLTTSMIFDAGVYLAVVGLIMISINLLGTTRGSSAGGEGTRERVDESLEGELPGPLETVRGEEAHP